MSNTRPQIVIIGGGFGGLFACLGLKGVEADITLIDRNNYHCFQPLLYQVATAGLSPANIASPLRGLVRRQRNTTVIMGQVTRIEADQQQVVLDDGHHLAYDHLIVAAGALTNWFGNEAQWGPVAPGLKSLEDALYLRKRIFAAFENFERHPEQIPTFVVAGGGPTGIEMAGAIAELAHSTLKRDFRRCEPANAKVVLVEAAPRLLGPFPEDLADRAKIDLQKLGVEVRLGTMVKNVTEEAVTLTTGDEEPEDLPCTLMIWATGVSGNPLNKELERTANATIKRGGRVLVDDHCRLPDDHRIQVIGDLAYFPDLREENDPEQAPPLPGVAPAAMQQGRYVAQFLKKTLRGKEPKPFTYWDKGSMATIGRGRAVAMTKSFKFTGFMAWMAWLFIHIMYLAGAQNRLLVLMQWAWAYTTMNRNARLITGTPNPATLAEIR